MNPDDNTGQDKEKINAIIRYHYGVDPNTLTNEQWAQKFQDWIFIERLRNNTHQQQLEQTLEKVLYKVVQDVFKALNKNS